MRKYKFKTAKSKKGDTPNKRIDAKREFAGMIPAN